MIKKIIIPILVLTFALASCADPSAGSGVPEFFSGVKEISAGDNHTVAIKTDGTLWAWGDNEYVRNGGEYGKLGNGNKPRLTTSPKQVGGDNDWDAVSAGSYHTVAIKNDGTLWAWGNNGIGQLGDNSTTNRGYPTKVNEPSEGHGIWIAVSAGGNHTLAIKKDGTLWAWGANYSGQLGINRMDINNRTTPDQVKIIGIAETADDDWIAVSAGSLHSMAIKSNGELWAWGHNTYGGELGIGNTTDKISPVKVNEPSGGHGIWVAVSAAERHTVAIKEDGTLWAWGNNGYGKLGIGSTGGTHYVPEQVSEPGPWVAVSAKGDSHTVAIKEDSTLWAWGDNSFGQLGNGKSGGSEFSAVPVKVGDNWRKISAGYWHTAAIKEDGVLWSWGYNEYGQLGDATVKDKSTPARVILSGW